MEYWSDLYTEIAEKIKAKLPKVEWIDLWHEQVSYLTTELPFPTPSIFIAFSMLDAEDEGLYTQICNTQVDFYYFYETFSDTYEGSYNQTSALNFLKELTEIHKLFHATSGKNYSQMRRVDMKREDSGDAGNMYRMSFQCVVNDTSAMRQYQDKDVNEILTERGVINNSLPINPVFDLEH